MLENIYNDIISPDVNLAGAITKLVLSLLLGATIGIERRRKGQIAGLRTFALISMGATLAMLISSFISSTSSKNWTYTSSISKKSPFS